MIMKRILTFVLTVAASVAILNADDRPVTVDRLPAAARTFITENYPDDKISYATVDDDFIRPDYRVVLANGVKIQFDNSGALEKIESLNGVPEALIPVQVKDYLSAYYPDVKVVEYEVGRRTYDVKLSNRLELKFNSRFALVEIDD